ncbi:EF-P 5-aminopentanol modification-associated protein YfmF [Enterococcus timonensis]|uniref:EF-P 5-aminopentanol modification-associated protein YfmF n=1 Tax=Enterococcus timonensis TaxID=1852364 RepID=UPI0008DADD4D|nr:pitrilysin family protein [Enterococcus timonensis]
MTEIKSGVNLHVLTTEKYKTVRINIRFATELASGVATKRTLLSSLLETNSQKYPTQNLLADALADLFGASFSINVGKKGRLHILTVSMNVVNEKFIEEKGILENAVEFLKEILFAPHFVAEKFHQETFDREKENLVRYLQSVYEDKQTYASAQLSQLYFTDEAQQVPSYGNVSELQALTNQELTRYYQEMMANDRVDILVIGDITEKAAEKLFKNLPFVPRETKLPDLQYQQALSPVVAEKQEQQDILQAKLNVAYQVPADYDGKNYFPLLVFNGIFGGFPHSKLFLNVREKESLAYYASSSFDVYRQYLTVQSGIDTKNRDHVLSLINQQLVAIQQGQISDLELNQTKANWKNQFLMQQDTMQGQLEMFYKDIIAPKSAKTNEQWLEELAAVSKDDVQQVARQIRLQSIYFLAGKEQE